MEENKWTVEKADEYLNAIPRFTNEKHSAQGLRKMLAYLDVMPQKETIVHVAGTNGKGSVCSFLDSILQRAGKKTARFTSPHLVRVTERFSFDGCEAEDTLFLEAFEAVKAAYTQFEREGLGHPTYFEYLFLMFMWMVRLREPEYVILETGLGGRLDATNCLEHPALTVITSISLDHMEYLGNTVEEIAGEKAGILKPGVPVIYDDTDQRASEVIRARAKELSCPAYPIGSSAYTELCREKGGLRLKWLGAESEKTENRESQQELFVPFEAEYQAVNACLAYQAAKLLKVDGQTAAEGIRKAAWAGRMEEIQDGVYLDGAHNEGGIRAFAEAASAIARRRNEENGRKGKIFLLFAAVSDKNYESMLEILMRKMKPDHLVLTHLETGRALPLDEMEQAAQRVADRVFLHESGNLECGDGTKNKTKKSQTAIRCIPDVKEACQWMLQEKRPEDTVFCMGSLYLIGELEAVYR